ncbi:DUF6460 domain-containing protein [Parvularcula dongshanensis]|uniref:ABC-type uncharacterized transport system permease subunit n=1 Tax=Parvularcula dongshanensis TaxID=1173995 RepID=A0A840I645_9PROT|nr:DUF6460 domain-containing protein [Parvularcula dongshanensis]MBB4659741.1 ABC-type uncharacterized transport system permease subunit [Parvularcula dongshanensis]
MSETYETQAPPPPSDRSRYAAPRRSHAVRGTVVTLIKLIVACLVVGFLLALLGVNPVELWQSLWRAAVEGVRNVFDFGTDGIALVLGLIATGAVVVLPIWLVTRLLKMRGR